MVFISRLLVGMLAVANCVALAQRGDRRDEEQRSRVPKELIPPAPWLSPEQALKTFKIKEGLQIQCIAHEPHVESPVALEFGPDGRMWVVEMRGFMPNVEGRGEQDIPGRIVVLEDTNDDGKMDKKTVFLDNLVMPRALALARDGVLVAEPPRLLFCRDTNGDGKADEKIEVARDYGNQKNPEHSANGLVRNIDNWFYSLYHTYRYRDDGTSWTRELTPQRTQWGLSHDDVGRLFYTSNSDHLRGDIVPSHYLAGRRPGARMPGVNLQIARVQATWPGRVNPGVNRGYDRATLRDDFRLARFTAACGTMIYRGDLLSSNFYGNAFVCEPAGNFIRRSILAEKDGVIMATNAYATDEFLTSQDERFRPVNIYTGPDGAIYVVDMYHGIVQHKTYVTTYLRKQIESRGLEKPIHQGRIYRIAPRGAKRRNKPNLAHETSALLVDRLAHPNGWWRDTAQRLLVERRDAWTVPELKQMAKSDAAGFAPPPLHALWTLEGMGKLDEATVVQALGHANGKVRAAGVRLAEAFLKTNEAARSKVLAMTGDTSADVQVQLAATLGTDQRLKEALRAVANSSPFPLAREVANFSLVADEKSGKTNAPVAKAKPLTPDEQKLFNSGKEVYEATCLACHQPHGMGQEGLAPPLAGTEWAGYSPERLIRVVLHGLRGPIKVKGQTYEMDMPALGVLDDEQIASALTYVRREWGHAYSAVKPEVVKKVRAETEKREEAWTEAELLKIP